MSVSVHELTEYISWASDDYLHLALSDGTDGKITKANIISGLTGAGALDVYYVKRSNNLSDIANPALARANLNLGSVALLNQITKANIVDFSEADYATAAQGLLADSALQAGDNISELVNDAGYIPSSQKGVANGVASLGSNGKIPELQIPAIAITDTFVVESEAEMLALDAQVGDVAIRNDESQSYILQGTDPSDLADWQELKTPTGGVASVNGQTGTVVLTTDDIDDTSTINKFVTGAEKTKLDGIAVGATANQTDAYLLSRSNHTGTQTLATISDAGTAAAATLTTSTSDTTLGRVLRVGDQEIGTRHKNIGALNYITAQWYSICTIAGYSNKTTINIYGGRSSFTGRGEYTVITIGGGDNSDETKAVAYRLTNGESPFSAYRIVGNTLYALGNSDVSYAYIEAISTSTVVTPTLTPTTDPGGTDCVVVSTFNTDSVVPVENGGTGANNAADARTNLRAASTDVATTSTNGLMSSADKAKIDGIAVGAEVNQNAFSTISVAGQSDVTADSKTDVVTFVGGTGVNISTDPVTDTITFEATGVGTGSIEEVIAGTGLTGGGTTSTVTLNVSYGTTTGTAAQGNDSRLSDSREWTATTIDQSEAEAGTATTRRAWTAQRVRQATVAWWNTTGTAVGKALLNLTNPGATRFLRINADNTVTARSESEMRTDLGLGTAATQTVVTDNEDTTPGRVLTVGYGGLSVPISVSDFSTIEVGQNRNVLFRTPFAPADRPSSVNYYSGIAFGHDLSSSFESVLVTSSDDHDIRGALRLRNKVDDVWQPWRRVLDDRSLVTGNEDTTASRIPTVAWVQSYTGNLTASRALVSDASGKVSASAVTSTEIDYLSGVTSDIQTQLNGKASTAVATTSVNGLMSSTDKTKLDGIATGAEVNQNAFTTIAVSGQSSVVADSKTDTLTLVAGTGIAITTNATTDAITIASTGTGTGTITNVVAGSGLTGGGTSSTVTLNVGAGDGISVAADTVAVDSTVVRTTGAQSIGGAKTFTSEVTAPSFNTTSSLKYKKDVTPFENALEKLMAIDVITYKRKIPEGEPQDDKTYLGVSAESLAKVVPELVNFKDGEADSVNYAQGFALCVQAIQELVERSSRSK